MHLLFYAARIARPGEVTGAEISTLGLCRALASRDCSVAVLRGMPDEAGPPLTATADDGYVTIQARDPAAALAGLIERSRPDCVVFVTAPDLAPAIAACSGAGVPIAVMFNSAHLGAAGVTFIDHPFYLYLAQSRFMAARAASWFGISVAAVPPIIDPNDHRADAGGDRVLLVNPSRDKGWEIAAALAERLPQFPFTVIESWRLDEAWRRHCADRLSPLANVEWHRPARDMRPIWARTRLLLMPTVVEEAWGRTASEAHVNGIPVVASNRGGLPETVGPGGVIVDLHAPIAEWAAAVERLMTDVTHYAAVSAAARAHAARPEIQPDAVADRFLRLVSEHVGRYRQGIGS